MLTIKLDEAVHVGNCILTPTPATSPIRIIAINAGVRLYYEAGDELELVPERALWTLDDILRAHAS
ncbi:hypothetical protein J2Y69_003231 [Microbacterium resistens]|uniref:Uncharacterized protein n=1 Tax=Microbacterium resistens TaxID=156977 RepID=A0ABU1SGD0_9MICO|nr:hypothetical protein [Microbacterium resistens]MDR6868607.1 hypothetical protein [Microbacterium resistens]